MLTRRSAIAAITGAAALCAQAPENAPKLSIAPGPFTGTRESLAGYQVPDWFRDAKFGIWAHWGPQSAVEDGDWYARNMYMQGSDQYQYHVTHHGHPSRVGYKDLIPTWHANEFDPDHLMGLYKKAGAKYFVSMAVHHDNFDLWNSKHQRWNAVQMGPKKDVVGLFRKAAQKHGLKFGVSEHLWITYKWFSVSHGHDDTGPLANVAYDGADARFADLYGSSQTVYNKLPWNEEGIPVEWKQHWYARIKDLVDQYQPDLLYTDGPLPFEEYGSSIVAHLYNLSAKRNGGAPNAVYNSKRQEDCTTGTCVLDVERGVVDSIWPAAWQTDTSVGDWHYRKNDTYKTPKQVVDLLVDIVSRNGNLLLNFPLPNSGALNTTELGLLDDITTFMKVNGEGIYATRPWKVYGEGPSTQVAASQGEAKFNESKRKQLTAEDVRFTTRGDVLYAFVMGVPHGDLTVANAPEKVQNVELLGGGKLKWTRETSGLRINFPENLPEAPAICLKIAG
jgi:alpha-L-fucosidase